MHAPHSFRFWDSRYFKRYEILHAEGLHVREPHLFNPNFENDYLKHSVLDFNGIIDDILSYSRYPDELVANEYTYEIDLTEQLVFKASTHIKEAERKLSLNFSAGLLLAIDDIFYRLFSSDVFYSFDLEECLWKGCRCFQPIGHFQPSIRYYDYTPNFSPDIAFQLALSQIPAPGSRANTFFSKIPLFDPQRVQMAQQMISLAMAYVFFHEEAHFWDGHHHYRKYLRESGTSVLPAVSQVMEWQADRQAARSVYDLANNTPFQLQVPDYASEKVTAWQLRAIFTSIGVVQLILQKAALIKGQSAYYPSPRSRVINCFYQVINSYANFAMTPESAEILYESLGGALSDLQIATQLILGEDDDNLDFHKDGFTMSPDDYFQEEDWDDLMRCFLSGGQVSDTQLNNPNILQCFIENDDLLNAHNDILFAKLLPFRKMTSIKKTIYGE